MVLSVWDRFDNIGCLGTILLAFCRDLASFFFKNSLGGTFPDSADWSEATQSYLSDCRIWPQFSGEVRGMG